MYFDTCEVAPLMTNCYLLGDEEAGVCAVVDPGGSLDALLRMIDKSGLTPTMILLTHGHYDHVRAVPGLLEKYPDLPVYIHEKELCEADAWKKRWWLPHQGKNQRTYDEGDTLTMGKYTFHVLHTPGHSAGSVVLLVDDFMLSGDTLFGGACGRWDLDGGSEEDILNSLARLGKIEREYKVLPGHGAATLLSREQEYNPYMRKALTR